MTSRIALALEKLRSNGLTAKEYGKLGKQWQALLDVVEAANRLDALSVIREKWLEEDQGPEERALRIGLISLADAVLGKEEGG